MDANCSGLGRPAPGLSALSIPETFPTTTPEIIAHRSVFCRATPPHFCFYSCCGSLTGKAPAARAKRPETQYGRAAFRRLQA